MKEMTEMDTSMKTRKSRITDKVVRIAAVIDSRPWCYIAFFMVTAAFMVACGFAYNSVVPAYQ